MAEKTPEFGEHHERQVWDAIDGRDRTEMDVEPVIEVREVVHTEGDTAEMPVVQRPPVQVATLKFPWASIWVSAVFWTILTGYLALMSPPLWLHITMPVLFTLACAGLILAQYVSDNGLMKR